MKKIVRTTVAASAFAVAALGVTGVASAAEPDYVPAEVQGITQTPAVESANVSAAQAATVSAGTLPYTGNDSSLPLAEVGVVLLAAGGATVLVVKRRQARA